MLLANTRHNINNFSIQHPVNVAATKASETAEAQPAAKVSMKYTFPYSSLSVCPTLQSA